MVEFSIVMLVLISFPGCIFLTLFLLHVTRWQPLICSRRLLIYSIYLMCLWITIAAPGPFVRDDLCSSGNTKRIRLPPAARGGSPAILLNLSILVPKKAPGVGFHPQKQFGSFLILPAFPTKFHPKTFQGWNPSSPTVFR